MAHQANPSSASNPSLDAKDYGTLDKKDSVPYEAGGETPGAVSSTFDGEHIYENQKLGKYFVPIPEYEGLHR
ncbi:hypothetical protein FRC12_022962 [Ceratobasidium sp. 428]|nr:hypothetical protein FRC12_022962 [Ceratobasidium sp. 428]